MLFFYSWTFLLTLSPDCLLSLLNLQSGLGREASNNYHIWETSKRNKIHYPLERTFFYFFLSNPLHFCRFTMILYLILLLSLFVYENKSFVHVFLFIGLFQVNTLANDFHTFQFFCSSTLSTSSPTTHQSRKMVITRRSWRWSKKPVKFGWAQENKNHKFSWHFLPVLFTLSHPCVASILWNRLTPV